MVGRFMRVCLVVALVFGVSLVAMGDPGTESDFLAHINASRQSAGLAPLEVDNGLRSHARSHSQDMATAGTLWHSSGAELRNAAPGATSAQENVGRGETVTGLHQGFMDSPGHRNNILGDFTHVGIGTALSEDGDLYVTQVFALWLTPDTTTSTSSSTTTTSSVPTTTSTVLTATSTVPTATSTTTTTTQTTTTTPEPPQALEWASLFRVCDQVICA